MKKAVCTLRNNIQPPPICPNHTQLYPTTRLQSRPRRSQSLPDTPNNLQPPLNQPQIIPTNPIQLPLEGNNQYFKMDWCTP